MKNKMTLMLVLASFFAGSMTSVSASNFNYNYVEVGVAKIDVDGVDNTYGIAGSYDISPNVNLLGSYSTTGVDTGFSNVDGDINEFEVGIGYHTPIAERTDATANARYVNIEAEASQGSFSNSADFSGYGVGVGVRHKFSDQVEGDASLDYIDVDDVTDTTVTVGGRYHFNETFSAGMGYTSSSEDEDAVSGTLRMNFL